MAKVNDRLTIHFALCGSYALLAQLNVTSIRSLLHAQTKLVRHNTYNSYAIMNKFHVCCYEASVISLSLICSKSYRLFLPALPKKFTHYSILFSYHYLLAMLLI